MQRSPMDVTGWWDLNIAKDVEINMSLRVWNDLVVGNKGCEKYNYTGLEPLKTKMSAVWRKFESANWQNIILNKFSTSKYYFVL